MDGAIHWAAGPQLLDACRAVPPVAGQPDVRCPTGEARITPAFGTLQAQHVIHTVGPVFRTEAASAPLLSSAYRSSLQLAREHGLKTVAFPAISCGVYGYPLGAAARTAVSTCKQAADGLEAISFYLFGDTEFQAWNEAANELLEPE